MKKLIALSNFPRDDFVSLTKHSLVIVIKSQHLNAVNRTLVIMTKIYVDWINILYWIDINFTLIYLLIIFLYVINGLFFHEIRSNSVN